MTIAEFEKFRAEFDAECARTLCQKGHDYAGDEERFLNFIEDAKSLGLTPLQVWAVHWHKHVRAILTYVRTGQVSSEGIRGRFVDERNYTDLGIGLIEDAMAWRDRVGGI